MAKQYDKEIETSYELQAFNAEDVAKNGDQATSLKTSFTEYKSLSEIEALVKDKGFDTFEITEIRSIIRRYTVA